MTSSGCKANRSPSERNNFKSGKSTIVDIFKKDALASSAVTEGINSFWVLGGCWVLGS